MKEVRDKHEMKLWSLLLTAQLLELKWAELESPHLVIRDYMSNLDNCLERYTDAVTVVCSPFMYRTVPGSLNRVGRACESIEG